MTVIETMWNTIWVLKKTGKLSLKTKIRQYFNSESQAKGLEIFRMFHLKLFSSFELLMQ